MPKAAQVAGKPTSLTMLSSKDVHKMLPADMVDGRNPKQHLECIKPCK